MKVKKFRKFKIRKAVVDVKIVDHYYIFERKTLFGFLNYYKPLRGAGWFSSINSAVYYLANHNQTEEWFYIVK